MRRKTVVEGNGGAGRAPSIAHSLMGTLKDRGHLAEHHWRKGHSRAPGWRLQIGRQFLILHLKYGINNSTYFTGFCIQWDNVIKP